MRRAARVISLATLCVLLAPVCSWAQALFVDTRTFVVGPNSKESQGFTDVHEPGDYQVKVTTPVDSAGNKLYTITTFDPGQPWEEDDVLLKPKAGPPDPEFWLAPEKPKGGLSIKFTGTLAVAGNGPGKPPEFEGNVVQVRGRFDVDGNQQWDAGDDGNPEDIGYRGKLLVGREVAPLSVEVKLQGRPVDGRVLRFNASNPNLIVRYRGKLLKGMRKNAAGGLESVNETTPAFEGQDFFQVELADGSAGEPRDADQPLIGPMTLTIELVIPAVLGPNGSVVKPEVIQTSDMIRLTAVELKIRWKKHFRDLTANTHPDFPVGLKIIPDADVPEENDNRPRQANAEATINPRYEGVVLYFNSVDVDDPNNDFSAVTPLNDYPRLDGNDIRANNPVPNDNRGTPRQGSFLALNPVRTSMSARTNADGVAVAPLFVTLQPGDNFRVAVSVDPAAFGRTPINNFLPNDNPVAGFDGETTPTLTVWRRLHVEVDTMRAPRESELTGDRESAFAQRIAMNVPGPGFATITTSNLRGEKDAYEGGLIINDAFNVFARVVKNTNTAILSDEVVIDIRNVPTRGLAQAFSGGRLVRLLDDDQIQLPYKQPVITAAIKGFYARAYIDIAEMAPSLNRTTEVAFDSFIGDIEATQESRNRVGFAAGRDVDSKDIFWVHHVVMCHQHDLDVDPDAYNNGPNGNLDQVLGNGYRDETLLNSDGIQETTYAATVADFLSVRKPTAIFLENMRDVGVVRGLTMDVVVAHEIGHGGDSGGEDSDHGEQGIMAATPVNETQFNSATLGRFRGTRIWGVYSDD